MDARDRSEDENNYIADPPLLEPQDSLASDRMVEEADEESFPASDPPSSLDFSSPAR